METENATSSTVQHHVTGKATWRDSSRLLDLVKRAGVTTSSFDPDRDKDKDISKIILSSAKKSLALIDVGVARTRPQIHYHQGPRNLTSMDLLPPEIVSGIVKSLDLVSMISCRAVCRLWRDLIDRVVGDTLAVVRKLQFPLIEDFLSRFSQIHSWYKHLPLEGEPFWFFLSEGYQPRHGYRRERYCTGEGGGIHWWYERGERFVQQRLYPYLLPLSVSLNCFVGRPNYGAAETMNGDGKVRDYVTALYPDLAPVIYSTDETRDAIYEAQDQVFVREYTRMEAQVRALCNILELLLTGEVSLEELAVVRT